MQMVTRVKAAAWSVAIALGVASGHLRSGAARRSGWTRENRYRGRLGGRQQ